jgi:hypothetical protein
MRWGRGEVISGTTTCAFSGLQPFFEEKRFFVRERLKFGR